jgi:dTDP-4-dehydrorhamnose reductase
MKYVVLGSAGQLGRDLCPRLAGEVVPLTRADADLTKPEMLTAIVRRLKPDVLINCAAYNFVDRAESEVQAAFAVNAWGAGELARVCHEQTCRFVHFSTDYVFGIDETREAPWAETDAPGPVNVYGLSKLTGEHLIRMCCPQSLLIRTCGLYGVWGSGGKGGNFVETMLRLAGQGKPLRVVDDQLCTPTYTVDLAEATAELIARKRTGLYHVTSGGHCSWYQFAKAAFELSRIDADLKPIASREYNAPARRPRFSVLSGVGVDRIGIKPLRPWRDALAAYLVERREKIGRG